MTKEKMGQLLSGICELIEEQTYEARAMMDDAATAYFDGKKANAGTVLKADKKRTARIAKLEKAREVIYAQYKALEQDESR